MAPTGPGRHWRYGPRRSAAERPTSSSTSSPSGYSACRAIPSRMPRPGRRGLDAARASQGDRYRPGTAAAANLSWRACNGGLMTRGEVRAGGGTGPGRSRRSPSPHAQAARRRLAAHIAATRHARSQRTLALVTSVLSLLVLLASGSGWLLAGYVSSHLARVDVRAGLTRRQQRVLHVGHATGHNSDTLMVVHITADHRHIVVISLPRDSWVKIPGFGMNKINAAIGLGGPPLMVRTVEQATGLTINDFVEVNFLGFVKIVDALGGVGVCLPYAVNDPYTGLRMSAGRHHVDGIRALQYARDRHSFALSDLARISDQQQLLSSVLSEAISSGTLTDPVRFSRFLAAAT